MMFQKDSIIPATQARIDASIIHSVPLTRLLQMCKTFFRRLVAHGLMTNACCCNADFTQHYFPLESPSYVGSNSYSPLLLTALPSFL